MAAMTSPGRQHGVQGILPLGHGPASSLSVAWRLVTARRNRSASSGLTPETEDGVLADRLDTEPYDPELLAEIQMLASLILACSASTTRFDDDAIDAALGLSHTTNQEVA